MQILKKFSFYFFVSDDNEENIDDMQENIDSLGSGTILLLLIIGTEF